MHTGVVRVGWRTPLEEAVQRMQSGRSPLVAVTGDDGSLVGLITRRTWARW
ncbi:MAG: CBS domain-containing protein [Gemmatimonadota bacterium]